MPVVVVGFDHRTTPADVVERLVAGSEDLHKLASEWLRSGSVDEIVPVSTCLRSEVYISTSHPARAGEVIGHSIVSTEGGNHDLGFVLDGDEAVLHLFRVTAGLQSTVLGEAEILGQVARSWEAARSKGLSGPVLDALFRHAVAAGKRARSDTHISHGVTSIANAAVAMAKEHVLDLRGKNVLIVGAGDMGERMAIAASRSDGVARIFVANRTWQRAHALAERVAGTAVELSDIATTLREVDVVFTSTGSPEAILTRNMVQGAGPLLIIDFAVPRDTSPDVEEVAGVDVLLLDDLQAYAQTGMEARAAEVDAVELIVEEEVGFYKADEVERAVAPAIVKLREHAESVRRAEIDRYARKLDSLDDEQRAAVEALTKSMLNKLLHEPTMRLKGSAGSIDSEQLVAAMRVLFEP